MNLLYLSLNFLLSLLQQYQWLLALCSTGLDPNLHLYLNGSSQCPAARAALGGNRITMEWLKRLPQHECFYRFRFDADEIVDLATVLHIPVTLRTASRFRFSNVEALGLLLARFRSTMDVGELAMLYDRSPSAISEVVNELCAYLNHHWQHLLDFDHQRLLAPEKLQEYSNAIHATGAPLQSVFGFIDCTIRCMCRPCRYQRQAYNGHKKEHALKYQAVTLPNGIIGHLYGPIEGRRNDNHLLTVSGLLDKCATHAIRPGTDDRTPVDQRFFQLFGDPAYGINPHLISPFSTPNRTHQEEEWNAAMAAARIEVEHSFGNVVRLWPFLNAWWKHRVYSSPLGLHYRIGVILTNAHNCLRPNQTSLYFNCEPPSLEEYFHV